MMAQFIISTYEAVTVRLSRGSLTPSTGIDWSRFDLAPDYVFSAGVL